MRLPLMKDLNVRFPRFKLRTSLLVVALFAVALTVAVEMNRRGNVFRQLASNHARQASLLPGGHIDIDGNIFEEGQATRTFTYSGKNMRDIEYHDLLRQKYEYSASHLWLPVKPDPPPPVP